MSEGGKPPRRFMSKPKKGLQPAGVAAAVERRPIPEVPRQQPEAPLAKKNPFWYRFRTAFGALLLVNLAIGGYVLFRTKAKPKASEKALDKQSEAQAPQQEESAKHEALSVVAPANPGTPAIPAAPVIPVIPENPSESWVPAQTKLVVSSEQQREILQWMLDEKRKIKPQNSAEKARINEEKRYLKKLIRGNDLPTLA